MKLFRPQAFSSRLQSTLNAVLYTPETEYSTTQDRLRVVSEDTGGETCTVGVWVDAGPRFETASNNGITNFLEHLIFKGTTSRSQLQLEREIENLGARFNAYTTREQTCYYAQCMKNDLPAVVNILGDVLQNPLFDENTIEEERAKILQEMGGMYQNQELVAMDHLHATAYQGTTLAQSVIGTTENIKSFTKSDLHDHASACFTAPRMAVVAAGGVQHTQLVDLVAENFATLDPNAKVPNPSPSRFTGSAVSDRDDGYPNAHIAVAVEGCGWANPDYFELMVGSMIVGHWCKGTPSNGFGDLLKKVSGNNMAESYSSFNLCYSDSGLFGTHIVCGDVFAVDDVVGLVQQEWMKLCVSVKDSQVARAKAALKTHLLQAGDSVSTCEDLGRQILAYNRRMPLAEINQRIDSVDANSLKRVCSKYIYDKCPALAGHGPVEDLTDYNVLRGRMYWLRF